MAFSSTVLLSLVQSRRHALPEWAFFRELANGTGSQAGRFMDGWALNCWPSSKFRAVAYEAKTSRTDFAREIADPGKRGAAEAVSGECWFLTPAGLVRPAEVPEGWGLVEASADGSLKNRVLPQQRPCPTFSTAFIASIARRSCDPPIDVEVAKLFGEPLTLSRLRLLLGAAANKARRVRGVDSWNPPVVDRPHAKMLSRVLDGVLGQRASWSEERLRKALGEFAGSGHVSPEVGYRMRNVASELYRLIDTNFPVEVPRG